MFLAVETLRISNWACLGDEYALFHFHGSYYILIKDILELMNQAICKLFGRIIFLNVGTMNVIREGINNFHLHYVIPRHQASDLKI